MEKWITSSVAVFVLLALVSELLERWRPARRVDRLRHVATDLGSFGFAVLLNRSIDALLAPVVAAHAPASVAAALEGLRGLPMWAKIGIAVVLADFCLYWIHRAQHTWDWAWRTHAWHHSVEELYWFSGFRTSFLHSLLYNVPQAALPMLVFQLSPIEAGVAYSIGVAVQFWEHTNVSVDIGWLSRVFVTPKYHRIHHSAHEPRGKNFAPVFSLWDGVFGTYVAPDSMPDDFPVGLSTPVARAAVPRMLVGI